jgi:quercetin dioxygenase-like cupin family protein
MALEHFAPLQPISLVSLHGQKTRTLFRSAQLELIHLHVPAGRSIGEHRVQGEVLLQCLSGQLILSSADRILTLAEGELVQLPPGQDHSVQAEKESEALLLIVLAK